jgi:hypothetical protein
MKHGNMGRDRAYRKMHDDHCMLYMNSHDNLHFVIYVKKIDHAS